MITMCPALPLAESCPVPVLAADHNRCDTDDASHPGIVSSSPAVQSQSQLIRWLQTAQSKHMPSPKHALNETRCWQPSSRLKADRHVWDCMLCCIVLCFTELCYAVLYCVWYIVLCHGILHCVMMYCIVVCRTRRAQVIACSSLLHHDQRAWAADAAPNSEELVWANLG